MRNVLQEAKHLARHQKVLRLLLLLLLLLLQLSPTQGHHTLLHQAYSLLFLSRCRSFVFCNPRPLKGSKKWNPLIISQFPQCSSGFILGRVPLLGSFRGSEEDSPGMSPSSGQEGQADKTPSEVEDDQGKLS